MLIHPEITRRLVFCWKKRNFIFMPFSFIFLFLFHSRLYLIQSFLKPVSIDVSWTTLNWALKGSSSLQARVIVKVEMRTRLAGTMAVPAHRWFYSPSCLRRGTLRFLLTTHFHLAFFSFYRSSYDWLSLPPPYFMWQRYNSCTIVVAPMKYAVQWILVIHNCAAIITIFRTLSSPPKESPYTPA